MRYCVSVSVTLDTTDEVTAEYDVKAGMPRHWIVEVDNVCPCPPDTDEEEE